MMLIPQGMGIRKMFQRFCGFCGILAGLMLAGCAGHAVSFEQPHDPAAPLPEYRLGFGDVIEVRFYQHEQFNRTQTIRPDGRITLERIGDVAAAGLTPTQLDSTITEKYRSFVLDPELTVFVLEFGSQVVAVLGEVKTPGLYPVSGATTPLEVIAAAGGQTVAARLTSVMLLRRDQQGELVPHRLDLRRFDKRSPMPENWLLQGGDILYVPRTVIGSMNAFMNQVYSTILPPIDSWLRALFWYR